MPHGIRTSIRPYILAALVGVVAVALRLLAQPLLDAPMPYVAAYPAVAISALLWGVGPAVVTIAICAVGPFVAPWSLFNVQGMDVPTEAGAFVLSTLCLALVCTQLRRHRIAKEAATPVQPDDDTGLTAWLRAVLAGAVLIPLAIFAIASWWGYDRAEQRALASVDHAAELAYEHALRSFDIAAQIATRADLATSLDDATVRAEERDLHQRLSDMTAGVTSIVNLNVWDAKGKALVRSDVYPVDPTATVVDRPYFKEMEQGRASVGVSDVLQGRQSGIELMNASIRRSSDDGSFRGIVAVSLSPSFFRDYYDSLAGEEEGIASFSLVRTDGTLIARWPDRASLPPMGPLGNPILKRLAQGERQGHLVWDEFAGSPRGRLVSFKRVEGYPLFVVASFDRESLFSSWIRFVSVLAAVIVPTTIGLVLVSLVALRKTHRERATAKELREQVQRRAHAEKSMVESQKLETLAVVTAGVAHDFNNLLAVVSASLHVHQRRHPELAEDRQVQAMTRAVQSGARLTRQLLSFSRKQALRPETVSLQNWLPAVEGLVKSTLGPNIQWSLSVEEATSPIKVDLGELELALINLVVNARHAMPDGGELRVLARDIPAHEARGHVRTVALSVSDTGVGIAPELLDKVLEPFFTTRERGAGSGLGLSQVQGFCTQADGFVRIDSKVGEGTTVTMCLPATREKVEDEGLPSVDVREQLDGRILLVEDNEDVAGATLMMLRSAGLTVRRVASGDEALELLKTSTEDLDLVFSDIAMPGAVNGIELAVRLRQTHPHVPVLLTTGYAERSRDAVAAGFKVLSKPVSAAELLEHVRGLVRGRATRQAG